MNRAAYAARKAAGLCLLSTACNEPRAPGHTLCEAHREAARTYKRKSNAAAYELKKRRGQCAHTGCSNKAAPGGLRCQGCIDAMKATRAARKALNKCRYSTGCRLTARDNGLCTVHAGTMRRLAREAYQRRLDDCLCTHCGKAELMTGHLCEACYLKRRGGAPSTRHRPITEGERLFYATSRVGE